MRDLSGLKVCFVAGTLGQGGAERQLFYMLTALVRAGAIPRVLCLSKGEHWQERIEALGVPVVWVGESHSRIRRLQKIIEEVRSDPPAILQSQHFYTNMYVAAAARILGLAEVGALRGDGVGEMGAGTGMLARWSLRAPRTIAVNSRAGIENAVAFGASRERLVFLPNVVDTSHFVPKPHVEQKSVTVLTIGRMVEVKRFDRFIRMIAAVQSKTSIPVRGVIIGDGPLRPELEAQSELLGLGPSRLEFRGTSQEVGGDFHCADIVVLTSDREGTPNVVLEAMASGLPVIATRVGGLADLVQQGETGFLIERDDEVALAEAVIRLAESVSDRIAFGRRARAIVEQRFDLPRLADNLERLYRAVLAAKPHAFADATPGTMEQKVSERMLVVTHVFHYRVNDQVFAYGPYAREMAVWADLVNALVIAAPCFESEPPGDCLPLPTNVAVLRQPATGGTTLSAKLLQTAVLPRIIWSLCKAMLGADAVQVRSPGNLGLLGIVLAPIFARRRIAKYAGQWGHFNGEALSVRLQRALLRSRWWNAPVLVYADKQSATQTVVPFFTSVLTESQVAHARNVARNRQTYPPRRILYAGRLSASKNVDVILDAIAALNGEGFAFTCTIVGEGPERAHLENQAGMLGIRHQIHFTGGVALDEVPPHYEAADILILGSETEGWPKTIAEAMTHGLVCIGSNRGLTTRMLADDRGFVVPPRDTDALIKVLRNVAGMPPEKLSALRTRAADWGQQFTLEKFSAALQMVIRSHWFGVGGESPMREPIAMALSQDSIGVMHLTDTLEIGGAERMAVSLANRLPSSRFRAHVCTTRRSGPLLDLIAPEVSQLSLGRRTLLDVRALWRLVAYIRDHNIRILHAHGSAVFISAAASLFRPYPAIVWHVHYGRLAARQADGWQYRLIGRQVRWTIAVSQALADWATGTLRIPNERVTYISNFVSPETPNAQPVDLPGASGERIVCVANFLPEKDHLTLIKAMELVVRVRPSAHLLLIGGGNNSSCERVVRDRIIHSGLSRNVSILGQRRDVSSILRASDIGVLSSIAEGLPLALLEYGEASLSVVVTSVGQCADVVNHGEAGIAVKPGNPVDFADSLLRLLRSPEERLLLGRALNQRVRAQHSSVAVMERVCSTYDQILSLSNQRAELIQPQMQGSPGRAITVKPV